MNEMAVKAAAAMSELYQVWDKNGEGIKRAMGAYALLKKLFGAETADEILKLANEMFDKKNGGANE